MTQIWLITDAGHRLGRSIAGAALDAGDCVVATARDLAKLDELVARFCDQVRAALASGERERGVRLYFLDR